MRRTIIIAGAAKAARTMATVDHRDLVLVVVVVAKPICSSDSVCGR